MKTLEILATEFLDIAVMAQSTLWLQGEKVKEFVDTCIGGGATVEEEKRLWKVFAGIVGQASSTLRAKYTTVLAFPDDEDRHPLKPFSLYRACALTADPKGWLTKALEMEWTVPQLRTAIHEASGRPGDALKAVLDHLEYFGLGTEAQIATLHNADALTLAGFRDILGGLRRMQHGWHILPLSLVGELRDMAKEISQYIFQGEKERW